jgi:sialidase-1
MKMQLLVIFKSYLLVLSLMLLSFRGAAQEFEKLHSKLFHHHNGSLNNFWYKVTVKKEATVAFLGGSITENSGWRNLIQDYLKETYPDVKFNFVDAGIASLGSLPHSFRLKQDVISKGQIDLLFFESAVNDAVNKTNILTQQRAQEGIIRQLYTSNPYCNIIFMAFADDEKLADYEAGKKPAEVEVHEKLAAYYHFPFINLAEEVYKRIKVGEFSWKEDFKDLHPSPFGQQIYFNSIKTLLQDNFKKSAIAGLKKRKLPKPLNTHNYADADYLRVDLAENLEGFKLNPAWKPADAVGTRNRFVDVTMLVGEQVGDSFTLNFKGSAIGIAIISGPDAGTITYQIDDGAEKTIDCFTQWSTQLHLPWYLMLDDELQEGKHRLKITINKARNKQANGNALRIVHFLVNN